MCIWDGAPIQPEDEREAEWHDSEDADTSWKQGDQDDGDGWKEGFPGEAEAGSEYYLNKGMERADDEDEQRNRRKRKRDDDTDGS